MTKILPLEGKKYRLITRSDMDGLVCAVLLKHLGIVADVLFAHPKDMQDGLIEVSEDDISTNLPYVPGIYLSFDHHASEAERIEADTQNHIIETKAPSAARVVYNYFGGKETFPNSFEPMMISVDKADAAQFSRKDILQPEGWELLSFIMDSRTGLGRFRDFNISNYQLMMQLVEHCLSSQNIDEILELPDVKERVDFYFEEQIKFREQVQRCAKVNHNLVTLDLRTEEIIHAGNRFMIYALYPDANISMHIMWGKNKQNTVFAIGKSIINRSSKTDIGALCLQYGGGGHNAAGTCQVPNDDAETTLLTLTKKIVSDG